MNISSPSASSTRPPASAHSGPARNASASSLAERCREAANDSSAGVGLALWCTITHIADLSFAGGPLIEVTAPQGEVREHLIRLKLDADQAWMSVRLPAPEALDTWVQERFDALARQRKRPDLSCMTGIATLLDLESVLPMWPGPYEGKWRQQDVYEMAAATHILQRQSRPVFLRTILGHLAKQIHRWAQRLPPTDTHASMEIRNKQQFAAALRCALSLPQVAGAPTAALALHRTQSGNSSETVTDSPREAAPKAAAPVSKSQKKKNKKKNKAASQTSGVVAQGLTAASMASLAAHARNWAKASNSTGPQARATNPLLLETLATHDKFDERSLAWQTALQAAAEATPDAAWRLVTQCRDELIMPPADVVFDTLVPLGAPTERPALEEANDTLWRLARQPDPLGLWPHTAERGFISLTGHPKTRLAALALAARVLLIHDKESRVPVCALAQDFVADVTKAYVRALKDQSAIVAGLLPLLFLAHARRPTRELARHLTALAEHQHLDCQNVAQRVSLLLAARPELMLELPLLRREWHGPLRKTLSHCTYEMVDALHRIALDGPHKHMARAISDAHGLHQARNSGHPEEARSALVTVFLQRRSPVEMDMLLSIGGTPMLECLQLVCDEMKAGTDRPVQSLQIQTLVPMLQQLFFSESASRSTSASPRALDKQPVTPANETRVAIRQVFIDCSFFVEELSASLALEPETLSKEHEQQQRYVLAPYLMAAIEALAYAPAQPQRPLVRQICQSPRLRMAWAFAILNKWPTPIAEVVSGQRVMACDAEANSEQVRRKLPSSPPFFAIRFAMRNTVPLLLDWLSFEAKLVQSALDSPEGEDALDEEALWYRTNVAMLAITRRNAFAPWHYGEPVIECLRELFCLIPERSRRIWAARLTGLFRTQERYAFFRPDEDTYHQFSKGEEASLICVEHFLPLVVAMCRSLPASDAQTLAHAYWQTAKQTTHDFQQTDACGQPATLHARIGTNLSEYLLGSMQRLGDAPFNAADAIRTSEWLVVALQSADRDGFMAVDRLLSACVRPIHASGHPSVGVDFIDAVFVSAVTVHLISGFQEADLPLRPQAAAELLIYLDNFSSWQGKETPFALIERIDKALIDQGHDTLTGWAAVLREEELDAIKRRFVAKRLLCHLLTNPLNQPLIQRLAPLHTVQRDNKEFAAVFSQHKSDLSRLIGSAQTLEDVADFIDQINGKRAQASAVQRGLTPALLLAARVVSLWNADLADGGVPQVPSQDFSEMPLGVA